MLPGRRRREAKLPACCRGRRAATAASAVALRLGAWPPAEGQAGHCRPLGLPRSSATCLSAGAGGVRTIGACV